MEAVIDLLNRELTMIMQQAGTAKLADITSAYLLRSERS
jgi:isopentenyl diphosphate isomerase/L-lactate dehydrogenase-like FMN-dependent dehydrogenase